MKIHRHLGFPRWNFACRALHVFLRLGSLEGCVSCALFEVAQNPLLVAQGWFFFSGRRKKLPLFLLLCGLELAWPTLRDISLSLTEQVKRVVSTEEAPESSLVHGVVFCKNVVHRRMRSAIVQPRILLLAGSLEYERTNSTLSSLSTSLGQVGTAPRSALLVPWKRS